MGDDGRQTAKLARRMDAHSHPVTVKEAFVPGLRRRCDGTAAPPACSCPTSRENIVRTKIIAAAAVAAFMALPIAAQAQGIVRGAQDGAATGNRAAGPVGGVVGGAVGAGVGGAVGGVKGVLGIPQDTRTRRRVRRAKRVR